MGFARLAGRTVKPPREDEVARWCGVTLSVLVKVNVAPVWPITLSGPLAMFVSGGVTVHDLRAPAAPERTAVTSC